MPPRITPRPLLHRSLALASIFALGATALAGTGGVASASPGGTSGALSASNNTNTIGFASGGSLTSFETIRQASWAPDGSLAIFPGSAEELLTVRHNDGDSVWVMAPEELGHTRNSPSYYGAGHAVISAGKPSGDAWQLEFQSASGFAPPFVISPEDGRHYQNPDTAPDGTLVYQVQPNIGGTPGGRADIGLWDSANEFVTIIEDGENPSISPDGSKVAFVRRSGSVSHIWVADRDGANATQLTTTSANRDHPTFSTDGGTIAFSQNGVVATIPVGGGTPTLTGLTGVPAYQPRERNKVVRLSGPNRFATPAAVSQSYWATNGVSDGRQTAESVVLSRSDTFADALGGAGLAAAKQGPLLMTPPTSLDPTAQAEIQRILAPGKPVYLLGSPGAISQDVEDQVTALGYTVKRLAGSDRFSTSVAIADEINPNPGLVLAATGMDFPDALAAGAAAGSYNVPGSGFSAVVVLTNNEKLPASTKSYLDRVNNGNVFGIGRSAYTAVGAYDPGEVVGSNRYETALFTAYTFFGGSFHAGVSTGSNWPDALAGGALMATLNGPLLLTNGAAGTPVPEVVAYLDEHSGSLRNAVIFGSPGAVAAGQQAALGGWISGPAGFDYVANPTNAFPVAGFGAAGARSMSGQNTLGSAKPRTPAEVQAAVEALAKRSEDGRAAR